MLPQETHHHLLVRIYFETRTRREKKAPHAPMDLWLTCRRLAWFFKFIAAAQQMGVEAKARATEEDRVNTTTCMPGTYDKKIFIDDEKATLIPTQVSRGTRGGKQQIKRLDARSLMLASKGQPVSVSACENITSSVNFLFGKKASLPK